MYNTPLFQYPGHTEPIAPPTPRLDSWYGPLSEPCRSRPNRNYAYPDLFRGPYPEPVPAPSMASWYGMFSEPRRSRENRNYAYPRYFRDSLVPITPDIYWFSGLSEPTRTRPNCNWTHPSQFQSTLQPITPDIYWFRGFEERPREKIGLKSALQQHAVGSPFPIVPVVDYIGWLNPLSEPVRFRVFLAANQKDFATGAVKPPDITTIPWFRQLSDPTPPKAGLRPGGQQFTATGAVVPPNIAWYTLLSEPVRNKRGLRAELQEFIERVLPPPTPAMSAWFESLSEPVRLNLLRGLKAWLQQFKAFREGPTIALPTATIIISATETNSDVLACVIMSTETPPVTVTPYALVSIQENQNPYWGSITSIMEH